ncbi:MAG: flagellar hook-basal body complex protein [Aquabacterium sp.]|jgi:flagellar hook protein FlgE|nr:MAG: flagellar hook-basal body complex protein [Aquabacterium sp.]
MLESIYVGLTGLAGYSKGLNVISNNVANLNSPGFKGAQLQFADLYYRDAGGDVPQELGMGLQTGGTFLNFAQGEGRDTGNDLDLMIDGAGLFVLRGDDGQLQYTRAGQFGLDDEGRLVDKSSGARVAASDAGGNLTDIGIAGLRFSAPLATRSVELAGNLSVADTQHVLPDVTVYDAAGGARSLKLTLDNNSATTPGTWTLTVALQDGTQVGSGQVRFANGRPQPGFDNVLVAWQPPTGTPLSLRIALSYDTTNTDGGTESTLALRTQDGYAAGSLVRTSFDADGTFTTEYSNGQTTRHGRLALAWFDSPDQLEPVGNNAFVFRSGAQPRFGQPRGEGFGAIKGRTVELSNVDLAKQFSELIITQRGYQASSQVITTANEMLQQLMDMRGKR